MTREAVLRDMESKQILRKVAIITGGASGLGKVMALALADRGARVAIADVDENMGEQIVREIDKGGRNAIFVRCDLCNETDVENMVRKVAFEFSTIDVLVNNAGKGKVARLWETPTEVWDDTMALNLRGSYLCIKYVIPYMIEKKSGRVINISSSLGRQAQPIMAAYSISKAGQIAMTVALAKDVAEYGIRVNAICPGPVETPWWTENKKY